jgi:hypothetical protein
MGLEYGPGISLAIQKAHLPVDVFVGELVANVKTGYPPR